MTVQVNIFSVPLPLRITGLDGISVIKQIRDRPTLITPTEQEYVSALELASSGSIVGAAAYHALLQGSHLLSLNS
jgi:hypothetical protein